MHPFQRTLQIVPEGSTDPSGDHSRPVEILDQHPIKKWNVDCGLLKRVNMVIERDQGISGMPDSSNEEHFTVPGPRDQIGSGTIMVMRDPSFAGIVKYLMVKGPS